MKSPLDALELMLKTKKQSLSYFKHNTIYGSSKAYFVLQYRRVSGKKVPLILLGTAKCNLLSRSTLSISSCRRLCIKATPSEGKEGKLSKVH